MQRTLAVAAAGLFVGFLFVSSAASEPATATNLDLSKYLAPFGLELMEDPVHAPERATELSDALHALPLSLSNALATSAAMTTGAAPLVPPIVAGSLADEIARAWAVNGRTTTPVEQLALQQQAARLPAEVERALATLVAGATMAESVRGEPFADLTRDDLAFLAAHADPGVPYEPLVGQRHALVDATSPTDLDQAKAVLAKLDMPSLLVSHAFMASAVDEAVALLSGVVPVEPMSPGDTFRHDTPYGEIIVTGGANDVYPAGRDYFVSLDTGGDDTYLNRAGGVTADILGLAGTPFPPAPGPALVPWALVAYGHVHRAHNASIAIDLSGNDVYSYGEGAQGFGAHGGFGALVDLTGDDSYSATNYAQGSGRVAGVGFLADGRGKDTYIVDRQGQGYGQDGGGGFLLDAAGDDAYTANILAQGTGFSVNVAGLLVDGGGRDRYRCNGERDFSDSILPVSLPRPGSTCQATGFGGTGVLADATGDDVYYTFSSFKVMSLVGTGVLVDGEGDDQYIAGEWSNGNGVLGVAVLVDGAGEDVYSSRQHVSPWVDIYIGSNGEGYLGVGVLSDGAGADVYESVSLAGFLPQYACGEGCAYLGGTGLLLDGHGNDRYRSEVGQGGAFRGTAALVDGDGTDDYLLTLVGTRGQAYIETGPIIIVIVPIEPSDCVYGILYDADGADSYSNPVTDFGVRADETYWGQGGDFARGFDGRGGTAAYATSPQAQADVNTLVSEQACEGVSGPARFLICFATGVCV